MTGCDDLDLTTILDVLRKEALDALREGDVYTFLSGAGDWYLLPMLACNIAPLKRLGLYEKALLEAYQGGRTHNADFRMAFLNHLFSIADPKALRDAGDPLPHPAPYVLFRGIAGSGHKRRPRGHSWTANRNTAISFATMNRRLKAPAILTAVFEDADVLAYSNQRKEEEFIVRCPRNKKIKVEKLTATEVSAAWAAHPPTIPFSAAAS